MGTISTSGRIPSEEEGGRLLSFPAPAADFPELVGDAPAFDEVRAELLRALRVDYPVLLWGETGTGKDLIASLLHQRSLRRGLPFVAVNCAAVPDTLVESELFGHRRGAFTGADRDLPGVFAAARGGTLFLDEVHQLSLVAQAKLLRAVETGEYRPLGSDRGQRSDARLVAATNEDLEGLVAAGRFRQDLFYRLHVLNIRMPSLRDVPSDIPRIARRYIRHICERTGTPEPALSAGAHAALVAAPWPGNVRQLIHELERALLRCSGAELLPDHLSPSLYQLAPRAGRLARQKDQVANAWEIEEIRRGLERTGGNVTRLARELGMSRRGLTGKIARYGLRRLALA